MTQPTRPSAWALKAAIALVRDAGKGKFRNTPDLEFLAQPITHKVAHIIDEAYRDRETGVAELLGATKDWVEWIRESWDEGEREAKFFPRLEQLEQAITKCEGGE